MPRTILLASFFLSGLFLFGCAPTVPQGALFKPLAAPDAQDTLVYVYRQDSLRGVGAVDLELDGENLGRLMNGEYLAFLLHPGHHEMRARMKWLQIIPRSWNELAFKSVPGQTLYIRVWGAYERGATPIPKGSDVPSSARGDAKVGLFMGVQQPPLAQGELKSMRRAAGR
jgi:hypothetical protein